ncbi:2,3-diaminopropionate biosynthesis protein SbnB [Streptomyces sp. RG80]|uniref:2,3-diaminopropionate biosynthesis protein SbnB n=1 Tax=Streptomyces sp. RG80 TaxID=3157340 RepID=UPI00338F2421
MPSHHAVPSFSVIPGQQVHTVLTGAEKQVVELVEAGYRLHAEGRTVNPPSYFLTFPDRPGSRIIALPASLGGDAPVDGLKWISSVPANIASGLPRASGVLILNDPVTGYPYACLETSIISAARTAGSAALAAATLSRPGARPRRIGFVGTGLIARYIHTYLVRAGWDFEETGVHDLSAEHARGFCGYLEQAGVDGRRIVVHDRAEDLIRGSDLVVFATVAGEPHIHEPEWFAHRPLVLNISLRDLAPEVVLAAANFVDDLDHCLRANTSVHLAEQRTGGRHFVDGTLADVLAGRVEPPEDKPVVFSPFGLGVLDLIVGEFVHERLRETGRLASVDGFFHDLSRHG